MRTGEKEKKSKTKEDPIPRQQPPRKAKKTSATWSREPEPDVPRHQCRRDDKSTAVPLIGQVEESGPETDRAKVHANLDARLATRKAASAAKKEESAASFSKKPAQEKKKDGKARRALKRSAHSADIFEERRGPAKKGKVAGPAPQAVFGDVGMAVRAEKDADAEMATKKKIEQLKHNIQLLSKKGGHDGLVKISNKKADETLKCRIDGQDVVKSGTGTTNIAKKIQSHICLHYQKKLGLKGSRFECKGCRAKYDTVSSASNHYGKCSSMDKKKYPDFEKGIIDAAYEWDFDQLKSLAKDIFGNELFISKMPTTWCKDRMEKMKEEVAALEKSLGCTPSKGILHVCYWGCGKECLTRDDLVEHMRTHHKTKPYKCNECPHKCSYETDLAYHKRTHTGEKPFKCDQCDFASATSSGLAKHKARHDGKMSYEVKQEARRRRNELRMLNYKFDIQPLVDAVRTVCEKRKGKGYKKDRLKLIDEQDERLFVAVYAMVEVEDDDDLPEVSAGAVSKRTHYFGQTKELLGRHTKHREETNSRAKNKKELSNKHKFLLDLAKEEAKGFTTCVFVPPEVANVVEGACIRHCKRMPDSHIDQNSTYKIGSTEKEDARIAKLAFDAMAHRMRVTRDGLVDLSALMAKGQYEEILPLAFDDGDEEEEVEQADVEIPASMVHPTNYGFDVRPIVERLVEACQKSDYTKPLERIVDPHFENWGFVYCAFDTEGGLNAETAIGEKVMRNGHYIGKIEKERKRGKVHSIVARWKEHLNEWKKENAEDRTTSKEKLMASAESGKKQGYVTWLQLPSEAARLAEGVLTRHCQRNDNAPHIKQNKEAPYGFSEEEDAAISELIFQGMALRICQGLRHVMNVNALMAGEDRREILPCAYMEDDEVPDSSGAEDESSDDE